jgi:FdrA protein
VTLMQASTDVRKADGLEARAIAMATEAEPRPAGRDGVRRAAAGGPNDLLIAGSAPRGRRSAGRRAGAVDTAWRRARRATAPAQQPPRTTAAAAGRGGPGLVLVSVPGRFAFARGDGRARRVLRRQRSLSDNMPVEQEITLKDNAAEREPADDGPGLRHGRRRRVGLGFAHTVARARSGWSPPPQARSRC